VIRGALPRLPKLPAHTAMAVRRAIGDASGGYGGSRHDRVMFSIHLLGRLTGRIAAPECCHGFAVGGRVIDDEPLPFGATLHSETDWSW
jgi:hypothetical protein